MEFTWGLQQQSLRTLGAVDVAPIMKANIRFYLRVSTLFYTEAAASCISSSFLCVLEIVGNKY